MFFQIFKNKIKANILFLELCFDYLCNFDKFIKSL